MIDNLYRKRVSEKKRCQLFENCANFACVQFSQSLIFATIGGFVRLNIRFASLTRRAFVAGAPNQTAPWSREAQCVCWTRDAICVQLHCLLDTELTNVCGDMRQECMNVCSLSTITYERLFICRDE